MELAREGSRHGTPREKTDDGRGGREGEVGELDFPFLTSRISLTLPRTAELRDSPTELLDVRRAVLSHLGHLLFRPKSQSG